MEQLELFERMTVFLGDLVQNYGPLGIAAAMFAESAGVPFASSVVVLTSGGMIFSGNVSFWSVFIASTVGIILGSIFSYMIGFFSTVLTRFIKKSFAGRLPEKPKKVSPAKQSRVFLFWERYGSFSVFMGQFWGVTRTFISFPAGAMHMNILLFIVYTALGGAFFSLLAIGFSIVLTGFMSLLFKYISLFLGQPPWVWVILAAAVVTLVFIYRRLGWKLSLESLRRHGGRWFFRKK